MKNITTMIQGGAALALDLLYPRRCPACDRPLQRGTSICPDCADAFKRVEPPYCFQCGKHLADPTQEYCYDCRRKIHFYDRGAALYDYRSVAETMYRFKYGRRSEYADYFGSRIATCLGDTIRSWHADAIIPVPVHRERFRKRGYNQAESLARAIGERLQIPVYGDILVRTRSTVPMKLLDRRERIKNLKSAFIAKEYSVKLRSTIVVDDIYTTGSTIDACAAVLKEAGVEKVYYIAAAIGRGKNGARTEMED